MSRRRLYLMRHAEVAYFADGAPVDPEAVPLTARGREQAEAARLALAGVRFDRVISSSLPRTQETARIVAPGHEPEPWRDFDEWRGGRLRDIPEDELERHFVGALHVEDERARFLGGESLGELLDRVLPALDRLLAEDWDTALAVLHGGVNRVILSHALTGVGSTEPARRAVWRLRRRAAPRGRSYLNGFEQAPACVNVLDVPPAPAPAKPAPALMGGSVEPTLPGPDGWVVRTVNYVPYDPLHPARSTTMEQLWEAFRGAGRPGPAER